VADNNTVARPYAEAIFEVARETGALDELSVSLAAARDLLSDGQSRMSEACVGRLMRRAHPHGSDYWRLQPDLPPDLGHMDDTDPAHLKGLEQVTRAYCTREAATLDTIAAAIAG
jgi:hypothetical protein